MANIGCKIVTDFTRPDKKLIELFRDLPVANIDDCMNRTAAIRHDIRPMNQAKLLGCAFTVKVPEGDNLMFHKAMDMAKPGDVIVIDAGGHTNRSILGEIMVNYCIKRGVAGIIIDGSIRDYDTLSQLDFPIYAAGITPNGPYKNGPGEINTTISCGGKVIRPGDIVVGDSDGVVVIRPEDAEELAKKVQAVNETEQKILALIESEGSFPRPWVDKKLEEIGCEFV